MPRVTVVTPAYNAGKFLSATIHSVLDQTERDFELLVVDDGSTDDTAAITESFAARDPRVRLIRQDNAGSAAARNRAIAQASGEFFALLDSDDLWMPEFLATQLAILAEDPSLDLVSCNAINMGGPADGRPLKPVSASRQPISLLELIKIEDSVCIMSVFRRRVIELTGGFDSSAKHNEDYDLWVRAACAGCRLAFNPSPGGYYRRHAQSKSANAAGACAGILSVYHKAQSLCADRPAVLAAVQEQIARFERQHLITVAKAALLRGDFDDAGAQFARLQTCGDGGYHDRALAALGRVSPRCVLWAYSARSAWRNVTRRARPSHAFAPCK